MQRCRDHNSRDLAAASGDWQLITLSRSEKDNDGSNGIREETDGDGERCDKDSAGNDRLHVKVVGQESGWKTSDGRDC